MRKRMYRAIMVIVFLWSIVMPFGTDHALAAEQKEAKSKKDVYQIIYNTVLNRKSSVSFRANFKDSNFLMDNGNNNYGENLSNGIFSSFFIDDKKTTDDGDYLMTVFYECNASYRGGNDGGEYVLSFRYHESAKETKYVNDQIKKILKSQKIIGYGLNPYQKIKKIHDYIIKRVSYDYTFNTNNRSAYDGLKKGKTVCNGYAMLFYKMCVAAGVDCKIVFGEAFNGNDLGPHAWNIVKLGDKWYNVDVTWNDTDIDGINNYNYFLKEESFFKKNHYRDSIYETSSFHKKYPMASKAYNPKNSGKNMSFSVYDTKINLTKKTVKGKKTVKLGVILPTISSKDDIKSISYQSSKKSVAKVSEKGTVTALKKGTVKIKTTIVLKNKKTKSFTTVITVK